MKKYSHLTGFIVVLSLFFTQANAQAPQLADQVRELIVFAQNELAKGEIYRPKIRLRQRMDSLYLALDTVSGEYNRATLYNDLGQQYVIRRQFDSVGHYAHKAIALLDSTHYFSVVQVQVLYLLGRYENHLGNNTKALKHFHDAEAITDKLQDIFNKQPLVISISRLYRQQGNYKMALLQYKKLIAEIGNQAKVHVSPTIYFNTSDTYLLLNQLDSAIEYARKGFVAAKNLGRRYKIAYNLNLIGSFLTELKHYEEAKNFLLATQPIWSKSDKYTTLADCYHVLTLVSDRLNEPEMEVIYAEKAYEFAQKSHYPERIFPSGKKLAETYSKLGLYQQAFLTLKKNIALELRYNNNKKNQEMQIAELEFRDAKIAMEKKEKELQIQLNNQQNSLILLTTGLSIFAITLAIVFFREQEKKKKLNQKLSKQKIELEKLDQVKSRFFANISHELRTPLTLISSPLHYLLEQESTHLTPNVAEQLKRMQRNTKQLNILVDDILDLSKLESDKLALNEEEVPIQHFLRRVTANFSSLAQHLGINYQQDFDALPNTFVLLDASKLEKILNNLLSNALKHTPSAQQVRVSGGQQGEQLIIQVQDSGQGISPSDLPHIFDRFFQSKQLDQPIQGGTGVGLALTKELVQLMGGKIEVESQLGAGSTFTVSLPYKVISLIHDDADEFTHLEEVQGVAATIPVSAVAKQHHILIAEDNRDMQQFIHKLLNEKYFTHVATNGKEALQMLKQQAIDLIVSDVMMPEMDGYALLKQLKNDDAYRGIPVVMLTALHHEAYKISALTIGVDDYLTKPFSPTELFARIHNLLQRTLAKAQWQDELDTVATHQELTAPEEPQEKPSISESDLAWLHEVEAIIRKELENSQFNLGDLADHFHLGERQFRRRLKKITGLSPVKYQREVALQTARGLLEKNTYKTIHAVAQSVGMKNPSRFSKLYYERFGKKPLEYLK
ncbi:MAG: ATP-binding protein [Flammeovirgaceae bacterium]